MKLIHDTENDIAYLYLTPELRPGESTRVVVCDLDAKNASVHLDIDLDGRILGIEILGASRLLRRETLASAEA